jgi:hypothetical protein
MPDIDNGIEAQDTAEAYDETNREDALTLGGEDGVEDPDIAEDVYDVTSADGDADEDDDDDDGDDDLDPEDLEVDEDDDDTLDDDLETEPEDGVSPEPRAFAQGTGATAEDVADEHDDDDDARLDEGLEETFPASDPVSAKHIT